MSDRQRTKKRLHTRPGSEPVQLLLVNLPHFVHGTLQSLRERLDHPLPRIAGSGTGIRPGTHEPCGNRAGKYGGVVSDRIHGCSLPMLRSSVDT